MLMGMDTRESLGVPEAFMPFLLFFGHPLSGYGDGGVYPCLAVVM